MDATFIQQNQIIERYLAGKLPLKGAQDFERYCKEHPETLASLGLGDRINAALRLLDASGEPLPWTEKPLPFYQKPLTIAVVTALAGTLLIATLMLVTAGERKDQRIKVLANEVSTQPLSPAKATRAMVVELSRSGPVARSTVAIGGKDAEFADFKFDLGWSTFTNFRVTIDRVDQGRVAVFGNLEKDSNGHVRMGLNSSALGPGEYDIAFEGLDWRGAPTAQAWTRLAVAH